MFNGLAQIDLRRVFVLSDLFAASCAEWLEQVTSEELLAQGLCKGWLAPSDLRRVTCKERLAQSACIHLLARGEVRRVTCAK